MRAERHRPYCHHRLRDDRVLRKSEHNGMIADLVEAGLFPPDSGPRPAGLAAVARAVIEAICYCVTSYLGFERCERLPFACHVHGTSRADATGYRLNRSECASVFIRDRRYCPSSDFVAARARRCQIDVPLAVVVQAHNGRMAGARIEAVFGSREGTEQIERTLSLADCGQRSLDRRTRLVEGGRPRETIVDEESRCVRRRPRRLAPSTRRPPCRGSGRDLANSGSSAFSSDVVEVGDPGGVIVAGLAFARTRSPQADGSVWVLSASPAPRRPSSH